MTLQTSIVITGDVDSAKAAVASLEADTRRLAAAETAAGAAAARAGQQLNQGAAGARSFAQAEQEAVAATAQLERATESFTADQLAAARAIGAFAQASRASSAAQRQATGALNTNRQAMIGVGQQLQDVVVGLQGGQRAATVFAQQLPQLAFQLSSVEGKVGAVARFLAGPWGTAILIAGVALGALTSALGDNAAKAGDALTAADALSQAQGVLGDMFDLATGKIRNNTEAVRLNTLATIQNIAARAQDQLFTAQRNLNRGASLSGIDSAGRSLLAANPLIFSSNGALGRRVSSSSGAAATVNSILDQYRAGRLTPEEAQQRLFATYAPSGSLSRSPTEFGQDVTDVVNARAALDLAARAQASVSSGSLDSGFRRTSGNRSNRGSGAAERLGEFGRDAATRISELGAGFTDTPAQVQKVNRALADLDDILDDVERRRPPNFEQLLEQGRQARQVIQDGINQPYREFLASQQEALRIAHLQATGRDDEAAALRIVLQLEQQMGPLREDQKDAILASVQAIRAEQREMEVLRARQQLFLDALGQTRDLLQSTVRGVLDGDLRVIRDLPGRLRSIFNDLLSRYLTENLFGGVFRELEDRVTGNNISREAAEEFRAGAIEAQAAAVRTAQAFDQLAASAQGWGALASGRSNRPVSATELLGGTDVSWAGVVDPGITVTGQRLQTPLDPRRFFEDMITRLAQGFLGQQAAQVLGKIVSQGLQGAAYGSIGGGIAGVLFGGRQSGTGAALGGALGNILGEAAGPAIGKAIGGTLGQTLGSAAGPIGSVVGGILGSLVGGLFSSTPRASATITSADGPLSVTGTSGALRNAVSGLGRSVQEGLTSIAEQLGGGVGAFSVSIGTRDGNYRVDPSGRGVTKTKKGAVDFGEDQASAVAYAIADAIRDGAITGLSSAVQQALRSSTDLDKALREALKVDELETLLAGPNGEVAKAFRDFERQAADRVRIARQYGFDVVKIEELNAKERLALQKDLLDQQVGSLQRLVDEMTRGSLFEGTAVEQRTVLLQAIEAAKADLDAGVDGAADTLAGLYEQLNEVSRTVYGTTGGFAADRASILDQARAAIAQANAEIQAAAAQARGSDPALTQTNQLLDENSDQNSRLIDQGATIIQLLNRISATGRFNLSALEAARTSG